MKAMLFAAGLGTRLKPFTDSHPKALLPLGGKTLLQWQLDKLRASGLIDIVINVHHMAEQIEQHLKEHNNYGCNIRLSDERKCLLETGGGLRKAWRDYTDWQSEPWLVLNVDILSNIDMVHLMATYTATNSSQLVVSERQTQRYLCFDPNSRLCGWTNIATGEVRGSDGQHLAFSGMQILSPEVLNMLGDMEQEKFSLIDFYLRIQERATLHAFVPQDYQMMDVGKMDQIEQAVAFAQQL